MRYLLLLLLVVGAACSTAELTPEIIDPVAANADWQPIVQTVDSVEMVQVPPGCMMMGSELGRRNETPVHEICFDAPYWIDRYEVTNEQYGSQGAFDGDDRPRENLTWFEARDHCAARGARLPTEAEWEYASRGPDGLMYPWGDTLVEDNLVFDRNRNDQTASVGSRPAGASWVGAHDMSGNVWEWVSSIYMPYPFDAADGREDAADTERPRVFRGGVHNYVDFGAGGTARFFQAPGERDWFVGFRCARDTVEPV